MQVVAGSLTMKILSMKICSEQNLAKPRSINFTSQNLRLYIIHRRKAGMNIVYNSNIFIIIIGCMPWHMQLTTVTITVPHA